ncbi:urea transporter [Streptomyces sp. SID14478]|uniref:urea transporter n=1 Tax=Streptomyces sp. SID14478 TaxID=2706073 RepID=UPI0013DCE70A|nr:urea transporter [Streptomyces sp. SID14478]NEB73995.1 urea transporter [Streptomyces sp. SID14478]
MGQVTFAPRALTGLLFATALFAAGWEYGLYGVGGAAVGTGTAWLLGVAEERLAQGMEGFNSCLVAVGCAVFLGAGRPSTVFVALLGSVVATVATAAAGRALGARGLPVLTLPFCVVASVLTATSAPAVTGAVSAGGIRAGDVVRGFLAGFGQIFLMPQWYAGAFVLAGLLVAGPRVAGVACAGNAAGMAASWALGTPGAQLVNGTAGYNSVLVALALGAVFLGGGVRAVTYGVVGAVVAAACLPAFGVVVAPVGGHVLTWPFLVTTLVFLVGARSFPRLAATP